MVQETIINVFIISIIVNWAYVVREEEMDNEELLMVIHATPDEVVAANIAIGYYLRHLKYVSTGYEETSQLLEHLQRRLSKPLPTDQLPPDEMH